MTASVTLRNVSLQRSNRLLFEGLSFTANEGEAVELRGANGSGKTSLLRAIVGLLPIATGTITLSPRSVDDDRLPTAYLGHLDAVKNGETVSAQLQFWATVHGTPGANIAEALDRLGIGALANLPSSMLSAGQKRRLALARLLVAPQPIWLLDEPAAPLDAKGRDILASLIANHRRAGGTVIAAIHDPLPGGASQTVDLSALP